MWMTLLEKVLYFESNLSHDVDDSIEESFVIRNLSHRPSRLLPAMAPQGRESTQLKI